MNFRRNNFPIKMWLGFKPSHSLLIFILLILSVNSFSYFERWYQQKEVYKAKNYSSMAEKRIDDEILQELFLEEVELVVEAILSNQMTVDEALESLKTDYDRDLMMAYITPMIKESSLDRLRKIKSETLKKLMALVDAELNKGRILNVSVVGESKVAELSNRKGGFHRIEDIIYMNPNAIDKESWDLVFIHELIHFLDKNLKEAAYNFGTKPVLDQVLKVLNKDEAEISSKEYLGLKKHVYTGLERGLIAEYRAWYLTIIIYLESGLDVSWMNEFFMEMPSEMPIEKYLFTTLENQMHDPVEGGLFLFNYPLYQKAYYEVRDNLRKKLPPLGYLGNLLN